MRKLVTALILVALVTLVLGLVGPGYVVSSHGTDVVLLPEAYDAEKVEFGQLEFELEAEDSEWTEEERRNAVIAIYGNNPKPEVKRILFADEERVIRPEEDTELVLYPLGSGDEYTYQETWATEIGKYTSIGAGIALVVLVLLRQFVFKPAPADA